MKTVYKLSYILREKRGDFEVMKQKQHVIRRNKDKARELLEINIG